MDALHPPDIFLFEDFRFDRRGLFRRDQTGVFIPVKIGSRAFDLLRMLLDRPGELVSRDALVAAVWPGTVVEESNLPVQISTLRGILDQPGAPDGSCIQTVAGRGYRFAAPVIRRPADLCRTTKAPRETGTFPVPRLSIVVLPFANLSNDPEQEYFADGITDDLTTDLSRISGSFVIARNTAFTFKGKSIDVKQIGRELGVRYVLQGSVRRTGHQVRVNAQLIDAESGGHLWADRFDTNRANLGEAQDEITGRLARHLNLELLEDVGRRIEQQRAIDPDARDLVMRGWSLFHRLFSIANRREAQRAFERALELDPRSVDAKIGLATVLATNLLDQWSSSVPGDEARTEQLLLEALEDDPNRSMGRLTRGRLRRFQVRLDEARTELETAIALDRNNWAAYYQLAQVVLSLGQPEAAIPQFEKALSLNQRDPNNWYRYWGLGMCHLYLGHTDEAIALFRKAISGNPRLYYIHLGLAGALGLRADLDEARAALAEAIKLKPEVNSLHQLHAHRPWDAGGRHSELRENTLIAGLRRIGFPDE